FPLPGPAQSSASEMVKEAMNLSERGDLKGFANLLEKAIDAAVAEQNIEVEAEARRMLSDYLVRNGQYALRGTHLHAALALFGQLGNLSKTASVKTALGLSAYYRGDHEQAARYTQESMSAYASLNDRQAMAKLYLAIPSKTPEETMEHI